MNLRQKLLTTFSGLALLTLATSSISVWAIAQWHQTNQQLEAHFQRSLLLKQVQSRSFRAFKEVPDAVQGNDQDAPAEFEQLLQPVQQDFQKWAALADNEAERQQVLQIRTAYENLVANARRVFTLMAQGRLDVARQVMEEELEAKNFQIFERLTNAAIESDLVRREQIRAMVRNTRKNAQLALAIIVFASVSLVLLLAAYLASDLFAPLGAVKQALDDVAKGDMQCRLDADRSDEIGELNQAFNQMVAAIASREQMVALANMTNHDERRWENLPSRAVLHQIISQLRSQISQLSYNNGISEHQQAVITQLDLLSQAVARVTEFGFPLDLNLARTNMRSLLYEVLQRFQTELVDRAISVELEISPDVNYALVDHLKLREALIELVRNALAALPEVGGRLGMRISILADGSQLKIEVADNGIGIIQTSIDQAFTPVVSIENQHGVGLTLAKAIVEQHGGKITVDQSQPNAGTYVQIFIPLGK